MEQTYEQREKILKSNLMVLAALEKETGKRIMLPSIDSWGDTCHVFDKKSLWALTAALTAERPLLLRGEPGSGKSQLARAAAEVLGRVFIYEVVHARSESRDLQYTYDTVSRLGEAQVLNAKPGLDSRTVEDILAHEHFLSPGPLWWAFDWKTAEEQYKKCNQGRQPTKPLDWTMEKGSVLLIDEIDKADADLPNGLLETLGNGRFTIPYRKEPVGLEDELPPPLVIITTNEERELPAAFTRRCLVYHLSLPKEEDLCKQWLIGRGKIHFTGELTDIIYETAAALLWKNRISALQSGLQPPGQAEYLDLLRAVKRCSLKQEEREKALGDFAEFTFEKNSPVI
ncbi:MAG: MoxR family ATPase [Spirochaetales bacterium]|nr:MoxR family ATPase [Spirochaetales bacterium]